MLTISPGDRSATIYVDVEGLDGDARPADPAVGPTWLSSDQTVAAVSATADGFSAEVRPGRPGDAVITASFALADGRHAIGQAKVHVKGGKDVVDAPLLFLDDAQGAPLGNQERGVTGHP